MVGRSLALLALLFLSGCLGAADDVVEASDVVTPCFDPCERVLDEADAFEPAVAVRDGGVLVAHTPFVDGVRTLHVLRSWDDWRVQVPFPDVGAVFAGCVDVFDAGAGFLPDGTPVVTGIAGDASGLERVLFAYLPDTDEVVPVTPDGLSCDDGEIPDFARLAATDDGLVVTWRHLSSTPPSGVGWSRTTDGRDWTAPTTLVPAGDPACMRGLSGPTPAVVDGALVVAAQSWNLGVRNCVLTSTDWLVAEAVDLAGLGGSPIAWPTPVAVGGDVWVVAASFQGEREVPTVWRRSTDWRPETLDALASEGSTTVAAASDGDAVMLTSFRKQEGTWSYLATAWDGAWREPVRLDRTPVVGHAMNLAGMGHYMGLVPEEGGFRAAWVAGQEGERVLAVAHVPLTSAS